MVFTEVVYVCQSVVVSDVVTGDVANGNHRGPQIPKPYIDRL